MEVIIGNAPRGESTASPVGGLLLDSNLIVTTNSLLLYQVKVVVCNNYVQVYELENNRIRKDKSLEKITYNKNVIRNIATLDTDNLKKEDNNSLKTIETKNIIRSKLECQRLAKCNADDWKTFITLTFAENIINIEHANKRFRYFIDKIQRKYKELKYICIPEFQKRGAVHYHLLTNIDIENKELIYAQQDNNKFKHIKYWTDGFTKVDRINNDIKKVVGYISKYMTKNIDNRLYNRHRYFYSRNLIKPKVSYLNLEEQAHRDFMTNLLQQKNLIYTNVYQDRLLTNR